MPYLQIMRLTKPWGIMLLAWPTLTALLLSQSVFNIIYWVIFIIGIVLTRSLGCVINDYADQWLDGSVARTATRPLVNGTLSPQQAIYLFLILAILSLSLLYFLPITVLPIVSISAVLIMVYPYTKRYIKAPQLFLGIVFSMGIPMAYFTNHHPLDLSFYGFFLLNFLSVVIYDTIYAMEDRCDDLKKGANSLAIYLGNASLSFVRWGYTILAKGFILWGYYQGFNLYYYLLLLPLFYNYYNQYQMTKMGTYFQAFLLNTQAGMWLFLAVLSQYL